MIIKAPLGELCALILRGSALDAADTEAEITFVIRCEDHIELNNIALRVGSLRLPIVVVDAPRLVLPRLGHRVRVSAEPVISRRIHCAGSAGCKALLAVVRIHHDISRGGNIKISMSKGRGGRKEQRKDGKIVHVVFWKGVEMLD
jgi:hypothetical protein